MRHQHRPSRNLAGDVARAPSPGSTFDPGQNRLIVSATDDDGNRLGISCSPSATASAGSGAFLSSASAASRIYPEQRAGSGDDREEVTGSIRNALGTTEIQRVRLGLKPEAVNTYFQETCTNATATAEQKVRDGLLAKVFPKKEVNGGISCNPDVGTSITSVDFLGDLSCNVVLDNMFLTVKVGIPDIKVGLTAYGRCETDACALGVCVCIAETIVDIDAEATLSGMRVDFPVTEAQIKTGGDSVGTFVPGTATAVTNDDSEVNCRRLHRRRDHRVRELHRHLHQHRGRGLRPHPTFDGFFKEIDLVERSASRSSGAAQGHQAKRAGGRQHHEEAPGDLRRREDPPRGSHHDPQGGLLEHLHRSGDPGHPDGGAHADTGAHAGTAGGGSVEHVLRRGRRCIEPALRGR
jgi:hypothetical protein